MIPIFIVVTLLGGAILSRIAWRLFYPDFRDPFHVPNLPTGDAPRTFEKPAQAPDWTPPEGDPYWQAYVERVK